jgi:hypothetical protein
VKKNTVSKNHEFHDKEYVLGWADKFIPTPERLELFNIILSELQRLIPENGRIVELGIGPGYLASRTRAPTTGQHISATCRSRTAC